MKKKAKKKIRRKYPPTHPCPSVTTDRWTQGYACACAVHAKLTTSSEGRSLMGEGGFNRADFIIAGVEQDDLDALFPPDEGEEVE